MRAGGREGEQTPEADEEMGWADSPGSQNERLDYIIGHLSETRTGTTLWDQFEVNWLV